MPEAITTPAETPVTLAPVASQETFSLEYVQSLRQEAAQHRTAKNAAVEQAQASAQQEWQAKVEAATAENARLTNELGDAWVYVEKVHQTIGANVPTEKILGIAGILKGVDEASIKSSAEETKALLNISTAPLSVPATDPTQGSGGGVAPLNGDILLNAVKRAVGAR